MLSGFRSRFSGVIDHMDCISSRQSIVNAINTGCCSDFNTVVRVVNTQNNLHIYNYSLKKRKNKKIVR